MTANYLTELMMLLTQGKERMNHLLIFYLDKDVKEQSLLILRLNNFYYQFITH